MNGGIRILVVDHHYIVREGLRALIETEPGLELVGEARDGHVERFASPRIDMDHPPGFQRSAFPAHLE